MAILSGIEDVKAKSNNVLPALVLKQGWRNPSTVPSGAIVTAGECGVCLAMANDMRYGIKLTVEEWNRVVEFVDSQIIEQTDWVNWAEIPNQFDYAAVDSEGYAFAYTMRPMLGEEGWIVSDAASYIGYFPNVNWQQSLRKRPGV